MSSPAFSIARREAQMAIYIEDFGEIAPSIEPHTEGYPSGSSPTHCSSMFDDFNLCSAWQEYVDAPRRASFASSTSHSPSWASSKCSSSLTPITPISVKDEYTRRNNHASKAEIVACHIVDDSFETQNPTVWSGRAEVDQHFFPHPDVVAGSAFGMVELPTEPTYCPEYGTLHSSMRNPPLNRAMFVFHEQSNGIVSDSVEESPQSWPVPESTQSQTIAPTAAFQPVWSSSPIIKHEPFTPVRNRLRSSLLMSSSPLQLVSPPVVPSQNNIADMSYESEEQLSSPNVHRGRSTIDRLHRRGYERKRNLGQMHKPKPVTSKSGVECDVVIAQNEFACSHPGCIDKQTGKQKRFKRQEHRKRHELTVHDKKKAFKCWVPGCKTAAFTRTDNLKSHQKNTHGTRKATQRNRYVATLDEKSEFYDPSWVGELTEEGYPIE